MKQKFVPFRLKHRKVNNKKLACSGVYLQEGDATVLATSWKPLLDNMLHQPTKASSSVEGVRRFVPIS